MAKIYVASKELANGGEGAAVPGEHSYWVYDPDGDPESGDERIIRGGTSRVNGSEDYLVEVDRPIANSRDSLADGKESSTDPDQDPYSDRNYTTVFEGTAEEIEDVWEVMTITAKSVGIEIDEPWNGDDNITIPEGTKAYVLPADDYVFFSTNCNTLTNTVGRAVGKPLMDNLPKVGGDEGDGSRIGEWQYLGGDAVFAPKSGGEYEIPPGAKVVYDQGGDTDFVIDGNALPNGTPVVNIVGDANAGTADTLVLRNVDPGDVQLRGLGDDLSILIDGRLIAIIRDQWKDGYPKINSLVVEPAVGSPQTFPLHSPAGIPTFVPGPLPIFVPDALAPWGQAPDETSPLTIDIDGDGVELMTFSAATTTTFFDIDGDGFAEQTAWVDGDDGLLVRDLDSSGTIDSSAELFGSATVDGFALLALSDLNGDHVINQYDAVWGDLLIWQDANEDAVSQAGELHTLASLGIVSIDLAGVTASSSSIAGNPITHTSTYRLGSGTNRAIVDAWFLHDNTNTQYVGDFQLDIRALYLPNMRGFGQLTDLHIAMSQNEELLLLVHEFSSTWNLALFADVTALNSSIDEILWTWAGVESVSAGSRGGYIDARHLEFMEAFFGNGFLQNGVAPNPHHNASAVLMDAYTKLSLHIKAALMVQSGASEIFDGTITYNTFTGSFEGDMDLSQAAVDDLESAAPAPGSALVAYWQEVALFLDATKGLDNLTSGENEMMDDAIIATDSSLSWEDIKAAAPSYDDTITGTSGNDSLYGANGDDTIYGAGGDDNLYGQADDDTLYGWWDNDNLYGGPGNDSAYGSYGDDTYFYESGNDYYYDDGGTDKIVLPSGIDANDLTLFQIANGSQDGALFIEVDGLGTIETRFFAPYYGTLHVDRIETIEFNDTTTFNFSALTEFLTYGTEGDDSIYGVEISGHLDDTIFGLDGNDQIAGQGGNDTIDGGNGNDNMNGGTGDDVYVFSPGFDRINWDDGGADTILLPAGFDAGDVSIKRSMTSDYDLEIAVDGLGQLKIEGQLYYGGDYAVETLSFNGASSINLTTTRVETIGTSGNDYLTGINAGASIDDIFDGREGDDTLNGGAGDDAYHFSVGHDTIGETGGTDEIRLREAWTPGNVSIYRAPNAKLVIEDQNGNTLTALQHFTTEYGSDYSDYEIEQIVFSDNTTWTLATMEIETRGTSGNDTIEGTTAGDASSNDTIFGMAGNDGIDGGTGDDSLDGGEGDDSLWGGLGSDLYVAGLGLDYVSEAAGDGTDILHITGDVTINDIVVSDYASSDTTIVIDSGVNEIHVYALRSTWANDLIEFVRFDDGFITSLPDYASWITGTSGNDVTAGNSSDNTIIGLAGNDTITGAGGNDDAHGGAGEDSLDGGDGNDLLYGGDGDDILYGKAGLDTMHGGDGADTFVFETASAFSDIDVIRDFSVTDADVLDLTDILDTVYDPMTDAIADFVEFTESSGSTFVSVDRDGTGGTYSMAQIIKLENVTGLASPDTLETNGNLLAA